ncbi:Dynein light chain 1, cytoplasmic [Thelohanellus kitauei]|uniref:Dynein light chain n=1 Tax=Thelohanellus kitauei TaxID=669202 RepID=A0A0C2NEH9_THEKT|nr:Dynein light chain 1, cytoplasmic [Thelohanellus kitauei]
MFTYSGASESQTPKTVESSRIQIRKCDMREDIKELVLKFALEALDEDMKEYEISAKIKDEMDRSYGHAWHVVVGKNFGLQVGHVPGYFISFYIDKLAFAVFKTNP